MNSIYLTFVQSLACSLSLSTDIWFPMHKVRSKCERVHTCTWAWYMYWLSGRTYTIYMYGDKDTSAREEIEISPPNFSEGSSLCPPIIITSIILYYVVRLT